MKNTTLKRCYPLSLFLLILLSVSYFNAANAQCSGTNCGANLIPNPGFEITTVNCTNGTGQQMYSNHTPVKDWYGTGCYNCNNAQAADYYNSNCANTSSTDNCGAGNGSMSVTTSFSRESVQAKLISPLKAGHRYCFSMKVKTSSILSIPPSDGIGVWFNSVGLIDHNTMNGGNPFLGPGSIINATPQIENPSGNMIGATCKTISGTFCATGGEQWILISNFRTNANTQVGNGNGNGNVSAIVIDELVLQENNCLSFTSITATTDSVCPGSCATLTANASGGNGTYTYLWSPGGETTKSISACPTASGTKYKCTISSSVGCAATVIAADSVTLYFKKYLPIPTITTSGTTTLCTGDSVTLTSSTALNYLWSPGGKTTQSIKVGTSGVYTVTVKHPVSACNTTSASTTVIVNTLPVLNLSGLNNTSSSCDVNDGSLKGLTATGAPTLTYSWSSSPIQTIPDLINVGPGTYTLTVTDGNGCKKTASATIINKSAPNPPVIKAASAEICTGSSTIIYVSGADPSYVYTWTHNATVISTNDTVFINNATLNDAGVYKITATKFGCTGAATDLTLNVKQTPDSVRVKATSAIICEGLKTILYVNPSDPSITYTWTTPTQTKVINDSLIFDKAKLADAGTYTVTATATNACISQEVHPKLQVDSAAIHEKATVSVGTICEGDTVIINAAHYLPGVTYTIYTQPTGGTPIGVAPLKVFPVKTTVYYMEATSAKGCNQITERDTVTVNVRSAPHVPPPLASNMTICEGKTTVIDVLNPVSGTAYQVYDALTGGKLLGSTPLTVTLIKTTTLYIEALSSQGCIQVTGRSPITITVNPTPMGPKIAVENPTGNYICDGLTAKLISSITSGIIWSTGETTASIIVKKAGTYTVYYTDAKGCASLKDSVQITIKTPPKVDASNYIVDTVRCNATIGGIQGIVISSGTAPYSYKWYETSDPSKTISTELVLKGVPSGKYTLIVTDKNGCQDKLSDVFIPSKGGIIAHLSGNPTVGFLPLDVNLITTTSGVGKPIDYVWMLNGRILGTTDNKINTYTIKKLPYGEHVVQVAVRDSNGCKSVDYLTIFVNTPVKIADVNIFTPNNDGKNDVLIFPLEGIKTIQGKIYDRWGLKMFEWNDPDKGWDGTTESGETVPEGVYYYVLIYTDYYGNSHTKPGYVQLMR